MSAPLTVKYADEVPSRLEDLNYLDSLLELLKRHGVTKYETAALSLTLSPELKGPTLAEVLNSKSPEPTEEEIMFHSSPLPMPPKAGTPKP